MLVTEKRQDGFHNLETVFYPLNWCDVLEVADSDTLQFTSSGIHIAGDPESNLVMKAYRLLKRDFDLPPVKIHLHKMIPFGAGLGGGSSDAAHMLIMLHKTYDLNLSEGKLLEYAATLGSDCSFFILNKPVFAQGRGEIMTETTVSLNGMFILLVKPELEVSTASAFRYIVPKRTTESLADVLQKPVQEWRKSVFNQFEESVFQQYPEISMIKQKLYDLGAVYASMSGSGSCVYGIFHAAPYNWQSLFPANYLTFGQNL